MLHAVRQADVSDPVFDVLIKQFEGALVVTNRALQKLFRLFLSGQSKNALDVRIGHRCGKNAAARRDLGALRLRCAKLHVSAIQS